MWRCLVVVLCLMPAVAQAHQPRIVENSETRVLDPEISKAYYGQLSGSPHTFIIESPKAFELYANILTPQLPGVEPDVSLEILSAGDELARLDATARDWEAYREEFAGDRYWRGQAYAANVPAGTYLLRVSSPGNDSRYALAIGEQEVFDGAEILNVLSLMPRLKRDFFETSPATFLLSFGGAALGTTLLVCGFLSALVARYVLRKVGRARGISAAGGIGRRGRLVRGLIGGIVLVVAVMTTWSPLLIIVAGFLLAQAFLGWCAYVATAQCALDSR